MIILNTNDSIWATWVQTSRTGPSVLVADGLTYRDAWKQLRASLDDLNPFRAGIVAKKEVCCESPVS